MPNYETPGVYVEEISTLPPSVAQVATAIPAFIGYTEKGPAAGGVWVKKISTLMEFVQRFGSAPHSAIHITVSAGPDEGGYVAEEIKLGADTIYPPELAVNKPPPFPLYYAVSHFFANGGGDCYIVSVGDYTTSGAPAAADLARGIDRVKQEDEPTLLLAPDAVHLGADDYYSVVCTAMLDQCVALQDRFAVLDVKAHELGLDADGEPVAPATCLRDKLAHGQLMYGAAYYPYLETTIQYRHELTDDSGADNVTVYKVGAAVASSWSATFGGANGLTVSYGGASGDSPVLQVTDGAEAIAFERQAGPVLVVHNGGGRTAQEVATAWNDPGNSVDKSGFALTVEGTGLGALVAVADDEGALVEVVQPEPAGDPLSAFNDPEDSRNDTTLYNFVKKALTKPRVVLPPSAGIAGIYARVDRARGVWKAPANEPVAGVRGPVVKVSDHDQRGLNIDTTAGKSINAVRAFAGKGTLVWGARTLAGNDNEWRYVPVRRLFIMIEESAKKATAFAVFEPNDATTWLKVKGMIESFLLSLWERGALQGSTPEQAYFVNVGLGKTMTAQDILEGRMIVEIGIAAVRPAEFVVLRFMHKLPEA